MDPTVTTVAITGRAMPGRIMGRLTTAAGGLRPIMAALPTMARLRSTMADLMAITEAHTGTGIGGIGDLTAGHPGETNALGNGLNHLGVSPASVRGNPSSAVPIRARTD